MKADPIVYKLQNPFEAHRSKVDNTHLLMHIFNNFPREYKSLEQLRIML